MEEKFNVILMQIGEDYTKKELYKKSIESIRKEFKNDNIIIFKSFEEIEQSYQIPQNDFYKLCKERKNYCILSDYIRLYLSNYIENMVYLDIDMIILPGLRDYIYKNYFHNENVNCVRFQVGYSAFFSKKKNSEINNFLDYFTDFNLKRKVGLPDHYFNEVLCDFGVVRDIEAEKFIDHFYGYWHFSKEPYSKIENFPFKIIDKRVFVKEFLRNDRLINVVNDENLLLDGHSFIDNSKDPSGRMIVMSESFYNKVFLKDYTHKYKLSVVIPYDKNTSLISYKESLLILGLLLSGIDYQIVLVNNTYEKLTNLILYNSRTSELTKKSLFEAFISLDTEYIWLLSDINKLFYSESLNPTIQKIINKNKKGLNLEKSGYFGQLFRPDKLFNLDYESLSFPTEIEQFKES